MWATLAFAASLSLAPAQQPAGPLKLSNDRVTYGLLGANRTDTKLLPGDTYWVAFDVENPTVTKAGRVLYSMGMELTNSQNKVVFKQDPQDLEETASLGGTRLPLYAHADTGTETADGEYTLKVTFTDRATKKSETLTRKFEILKKSFGLVNLQLVHLQSGAPTAPLAVPGQALLVTASLVNFMRDKQTNQPNIAMEISVLDEKGNPTLAEPFKDEVTKDVPANLVVIPIGLPLYLNRAGKFTVKLKAIDRMQNNKMSEVSFPLVVQDVK